MYHFNALSPIGPTPTLLSCTLSGCRTYRLMARIRFHLQEFLFMYPGTLEDTSPLYDMNQSLQPAE